MNVVFRADASVVIGSGHVMRCLTLARALRDRGCDVRFILREHRGAPTELLAGEGFPLTLLPAPATEPGPDEDYAAWLGVPPAVDAAETVSALKGFEPELLVVDHYALGSEWERAVKAHVSRLMVIDDLANRLHDCDLLLDQNFSAQPESRYRGLVPPQCISLIGPRYALLRPEYRAHRKSASRPLAPPSRILVFFGGSDLHGLTGVALDALSRPDLAHFAADVVVTKNYGGLRRLEEQAAARPRTTLHGSRPHLADLMAGADLAIGSGGATTWERMCIGLPSIVVAAAENQRPSAEALARAGLICYAGKWADASAASLYRMTLDLASDQDRLENLRQRNQVEVDGIGTMRVVEALIPTSSDALRLRNARAEDVSLFFSWANERSVRDNAINTAAIEWGSHQDWFARKLADPATVMLVIEANGLPVGQIRFDIDGDVATISYSIDPLARGRGWGTRLIALGAKHLWRDRKVKLNAQVRVGNLPSAAAFTRLGFTEVASVLGKEYKAFFAEPGQITADGMDFE